MCACNVAPTQGKKGKLMSGMTVSVCVRSGRASFGMTIYACLHVCMVHT
jgi:hypothetical protein